jgi:hypothetical protein
MTAAIERLMDCVICIIAWRFDPFDWNQIKKKRVNIGLMGGGVSVDRDRIILPGTMH